MFYMKKILIFAHKEIIAIPRESKRAATNSESSVNTGSSGDNDIPE